MSVSKKEILRMQTHAHIPGRAQDIELFLELIPIPRTVNHEKSFHRNKTETNQYNV